MKKIYIMLLAAISSASAIAQKSSPTNHGDNLSPRWALDVNLLGGMATQSFTRVDATPNYPDALNANMGTFKYKNGYSYGADMQLGYFFGKKRHFGLGSGILFMQQKGQATLTDFKVEYRTADAGGNVYRQVVAGSNIKEDITSSNINIPVMLKYKNRFSQHWGLAVDAGALVNLQMKNTYKTEASFEQGAIYQFVNNADGGTTSVYDNSPVPSGNDWFITKSEFLQNNPGGNWAEYAATKRAMGINVGDMPATGSRTGNKSYTTGSVGFMIQPSISYYLSENVALNFGGYYMMQTFKNTAQSGYRTTDGNGSYNSGLNNVRASTNNSYGLNVGARFFLGSKDRDHDGVSDRKDHCPDVFGLAILQGCPDTDKDGITDNEDSCATVWGLAKFNGCPDTDGDGLTDKKDECPLVAGPIVLRGCPDRDGDGIADKIDACPDTFGVAQFNGCPDTDGDGVPNNEDDCMLVAGPISNQGCPVTTETTTTTTTNKVDLETPIMFEVNSSVVSSVSLPVIEEAVKELNGNKKSTATIDGHADASGPEPINRILSLQRANAVKTKLTEKGINPSRIKTTGHGSAAPAADNSTYEGKEQNRRVEMKISPRSK